MRRGRDVAAAESGRGRRDRGGSARGRRRRGGIFCRCGKHRRRVATIAARVAEQVVQVQVAPQRRQTEAVPLARHSRRWRRWGRRRRGGRRLQGGQRLDWPAAPH